LICTLLISNSIFVEVEGKIRRKRRGKREWKEKKMIDRQLQAAAVVQYKNRHADEGIEENRKERDRDRAR
jgi:hypothetical protein